MLERSKPTARLRLDLSPEVSIGPGKIALLDGIVRTGSLSAATRELGMSYRRGWALVHSVNEAFRTPVVHFATGGKDGGGAELTAFGKHLVETFRDLERVVDRLVQDRCRTIRRELSSNKQEKSGRRPIRKRSEG